MSYDKYVMPSDFYVVFWGEHATMPLGRGYFNSMAEAREAADGWRKNEPELSIVTAHIFRRRADGVLRPEWCP